MPLYEYPCKKCHKKFAEELTIKEHVVESFFARTSSKTGGC